MPNPTMKDIDSAKKKEFNITLELVKSGDNYVCKVNQESAMKLLNVITGGGIDYLADYNKDYYKQLDEEQKNYENKNIYMYVYFIDQDFLLPILPLFFLLDD